MSLLEKIDPAATEDQIEPGKRLIRIGSSGGASLAERLSWRLHRLSWRTPFHSLRLRGRFPLKLLAVPKDPVAGDKAAGEAILQGEFRHRGEHLVRSTRSISAMATYRATSSTISTASNGCAISPPPRPANAPARSPRRRCTSGSPLTPRP